MSRYLLESAVVSRATQAIDSALGLLDQLDPDGQHFWVKADLENARSDINSGEWVRA